MGPIFLCLFVPVSLAIAIPALDTGLGPDVYGPDEAIRNFAILTDDDLGDLPPAFTICSSIATNAFTSGIYPFQLLHKNGKSWISFRFHPAQKSSIFHRFVITVSIAQ